MDAETRRLDSEILCFVRRYSDGPAPESAFNALALKIFDYQFRRNPVYRRWCASEASGPDSVRHWKDIPAVPASAFKRLRVASFPKGNEVRVFRTSGTTQSRRGAPAAKTSTGRHPFETLKLYEAAIVPPFRRRFLADAPALSYFFLMADPRDARDSSLSYMMGVVNRVFARGKGRFYVRKAIPGYERLAADLARQKGKVFLLATAFALKGFLDYLADRKMTLRLPAGSRLMETGGFKGRVAEISKTALYRLCARRLGVPVKNIGSEYGMTELSSQYYDGHAPAWLRPVVIDPVTGLEAKPGRTGLLRHVDLANRGSVIAVETEDLGRVRRGRLELLGRASRADLRGCSLAFEEFLKR